MFSARISPVAVIGIVLGAAYMLWMYQRVFFGPLNKEENKGLPDLNTRELVYLLPIVFLCFWIGLYPRPFFRVLKQPVDYVVSKVDPVYTRQMMAKDTISSAEPRD